MFPTSIQGTEKYYVLDGWIDDHTPREITDTQDIEAALAALDVSQFCEGFIKPDFRQSTIDEVRAVYARYQRVTSGVLVFNIKCDSMSASNS